MARTLLIGSISAEGSGADQANKDAFEPCPSIISTALSDGQVKQLCAAGARVYRETAELGQPDAWYLFGRSARGGGCVKTPCELESWRSCFGVCDEAFR